MKFAAIAASLAAADTSDNGNVDEKERKLNEMILELQMLREGLIRRVSRFFEFILDSISVCISGKRRNSINGTLDSIQYKLQFVGERTRWL